MNEEELKQLRHNLAHLSPGGVREFYERAFEDCHRRKLIELPLQGEEETLENYMACPNGCISRGL